MEDSHRKTELKKGKLLTPKTIELLETQLKSSRTSVDAQIELGSF
jgi:hypothetical protein